MDGALKGVGDEGFLGFALHLSFSLSLEDSVLFLTLMTFFSLFTLSILTISYSREITIYRKYYNRILARSIFWRQAIEAGS
jgi:hypothetical protein